MRKAFVNLTSRTVIFSRVVYPPRACFQTLYLPVCCKEDPPQPQLKRGENPVKVPLSCSKFWGSKATPKIRALFKSDLGTSPGGENTSYPPKHRGVVQDLSQSNCKVPQKMGHKPTTAENAITTLTARKFRAEIAIGETARDPSTNWCYYLHPVASFAVCLRVFRTGKLDSSISGYSTNHSG